ncbi:SIR2 family protein [Pseudomonas luteola]|uniref:SIR2 family protein n=1 Tax=Pseudomonas luteola TaxID=47886 RepID=A0ABS0MYX6_PSELU|nr:SIR2 family protein [Pseudomonas luteola]MBH3441929.1 SIR2 family protein [Pseudomonas luteola]
MIIDEIIEKIDEGGPKSYYSFEIFVLNLLKHHLQAQSKELMTSLRIGALADAIAPDGFDEFEGSTFIEIKFDLARSLRGGSIVGLNRQLSLLADGEHKIDQLIIISAKPISSELKLKLRFHIAKLNLPFKVFIWGPKDLNKIVYIHRAKVNEIVNNIFSLRLESAVRNLPADWKAERDTYVAKLKESYQKGKFSLFLGAGVSSSAGMPGWNSLLNSLFVNYLTKEINADGSISNSDINELVQRLNSIDEPSALMAARYLRKGLVRNNEEAKGFSSAITKSLYGLRDPEKPIDSPLIKSIASMCTPRRTGAKVRSVITYNFDDLLERQLLANKILHRCIYTEDEVYDADELPVYHVHGFLPESKDNYSDLDKSTLVFSEEGYHKIYSESYHWSNLVQLSNLRENNCLMIGLSMTDPNLRRLLDISARNIDYTKHYAFMKRITHQSFCSDRRGDAFESVINNTDAADKFLERHHALNEEIMKELGVTIIWYEDYNDIPEIVDNIMAY